MPELTKAWPDFDHNAIVQQAVGQLPWGHNLVLLSKVKNSDQRIEYAHQAQHNGWSRNGDFKPEYAGKLSFYLTAIDKQMKAEQDNPTIGLLLCKNRNKVIAEYALSDNSKPIGVAEYQLAQALPTDLEDKLPSIEQIEAELGGELADELGGGDE